MRVDEVIRNTADETTAVIEGALGGGWEPGELETAVAHELHGPVGIVAAAVDHARQVAHQGRQHALALPQQQRSAGGRPPPAP